MKRHLNYPSSSIYGLLAECSAARGKLCALDYFGKKYTYHQLIRLIDRCAGALSSMGVRKGDSVSVCLPNIPEAVCLFYAINKVGAVANMIHPMSAENEILRFVELTDSRLIFAVDLISEKIANVRKRHTCLQVVTVDVSRSMPVFLKLGYRITRKKAADCPGQLTWDDFIRRAESSPKFGAVSAPDDTAAILYSGGTTGKPKGIMLSNLNFNALALQSIEACGGLREGMKMLSVMPIFHGFGLGVCIHTMLVLGGTAIIQPKFSVKDFRKLIMHYKPDMIAGVPAI